MIEYIIPTLVVVLPSAGFIAGALFAASRARDRIAYLEQRLEIVPGWSENCDGIACRDDTIRLQDDLLRKQGRELAELRAEKAGRLTKANAARKSKRLEREAQERLISQARHKEMRELVGDIV